MRGRNGVQIGVHENVQVRVDNNIATGTPFNASTRRYTVPKPFAPTDLGSAVVTDSFDPVAYNRAAWDREVENSNEWTQPAGPEVISRARAGDWSVVLIGYQAVPRGWFPAELVGAEVLCLASGGGQQGPVLSAAGAVVTVLDHSPRQLGRDQEVAIREGLARPYGARRHA